MPDRKSRAAVREPLAHVYVDGASLGNPGPAGVGVLIRRSEDAGGQSEIMIEEPIGKATNNVAEYRAFIRGLEECQRLQLPRVRIHLDSELVAKQTSGEYSVKDRKLLPLYIRARELLESFSVAEVSLVRREKNNVANNLAQNAARRGKSRLPGSRPRKAQFSRDGDGTPLPPSDPEVTGTLPAEKEHHRERN